MPQEWGVTPRQIGLLMVAIPGGTAILALPTILDKLAGQAGWVAALLGIPMGLIPLALWNAMDRRLPGQTFTEHARAALGPVAGTILAICPVLLFASTLGSTPRQLIDLIGGSALPRTPPVVLAAFTLMLPVAYIVRSGLETLARAAELLVPLGLFGLLLILAGSAKEALLVNLRPVLAVGWWPILQGAFAAGSFYAESFYLWYILPFRGGARGATLRSAEGCLLAVAALVALSTAVVTAVFGPLIPDMPVPVFQASRTVEISDFITHLDSVLLTIWVALDFIKISAFVFCFCLAVTQLFGLRDYRSLTLPTVAFAIAAAIGWFGSDSDVRLWLARTWPLWGTVLEIVPPLLVWGVALLRGKGAAHRPLANAKRRWQHGTAAKAGDGEGAA